MLRKISIVALLCIAAAGCNRQNGASAPTQAGPAAYTEEAPAGKVVLADGYTLPFSVRLRSQRHEPNAGRVRHVVAAEFSGIDAKAAAGKLSADLASKGYTVDPAIDHGDGVRLGAKGKSAHMTLDVYGTTSTELKYPGSQGLIYATWVDHAKR